MSGRPAPGALAARLESVRARVSRAAESAGRDPASITLLAVTKGQPVEAVESALSLGLLDIGESRVQEARAKRSAIPDGAARWHMVGHLQRNKARAAATLFDVVHSLDSVSLGAALARHRAGAPAPLRVYIEVELTGIAGRSGVTPEAASPMLVGLHDVAGVHVVGLMTVAPPGVDTAAACFSRLRELRDELRERHGVALDGLSMGMSDDFEAAIAQGATVLRLGRALFGDRPGHGP